MYKTKIGKDNQHKNLLLNQTKIVHDVVNDPFDTITGMHLYIPRPTLSDKIRILNDTSKTMTGSGKISTVYKKQYPVISGNGKPNMEMEDTKAIHPVKPSLFKMETMKNTIDKPMKTNKIVEGSIIVENFKKDVAKNYERAKLLTSEIVKEKPIISEGNEPSLLSGGSKMDKMKRRGELIKLIMKKHSMSLSEASKFIKENNMKY